MNSFKFNEKDARNILILGNWPMEDHKIPVLTDKLNELYNLMMKDDETEAYFRHFKSLNGSGIMDDKAEMIRRGVDVTMDELFNMQIWIGLIFNYLDSKNPN